MSMTRTMSLPSMTVFGLPVIDATSSQARGALIAHIASDTYLRVAFLNANNANIAVSDPIYRETIEDSVLLPDGLGLDIAARILHGKKFTDNLNGTDFTPDLLRSLPEGTKIALIGAKPGVAERVSAMIASDMPNTVVTMVHDGFPTENQISAMLARLESNRPDLLIVAMGTPAQEKWVHAHIAAKHCRCVMSVGALFDFMAGEVVRAPLWVRRLRCEWVFRLLQEPGRLWKRYLVGNIVFIWRVIWWRFAPWDISK